MRVLLMVIMVMASTVSFAFDHSDAGIKFSQAGVLYREGKYEQAIEAYKKILSSGFESAEVYYNLANSYYRQGEVGQAVLNYERALLLSPRDEDLRFNVQYVLNQLSVESSIDKNWIQKNLEKFIHFYTLDEFVIVILFLVGILGIFCLGAFYFRLLMSMRVLIISFCSLLIFIFSAAFYLKTSDMKNKSVVVSKSSAYFEPRDEASVHFQVSEGVFVRILKEENGWVKVQRADKKLGWIKSSDVEKLELQ